MIIHNSLKEAFDSFERVEKISEVLILGVDGGIRRIIINIREEEDG